MENYLFGYTESLLKIISFSVSKKLHRYFLIHAHNILVDCNKRHYSNIGYNIKNRRKQT